MKKSFLLISKMTKFFACYGWKGIYSLFFPVKWIQDSTITNYGYDIIILKRTREGYFYGTYHQNRMAWK